MKRFFAIAFLGLFLTTPVFAQQTSSVDPQYPATDADITSYGLRKQFLDIYTDTNTLFSQINLPPIGANQVLGSLTAGIPSGQTLPSCNGTTNALTYTPGVGFGCNLINPSGTGTVTSVGLVMPSVLFNSPVTGSPVITSGTLSPSLATQNPHTFFAGPISGSAAQPTVRLIGGTDLPLPTSSSLGGAISFAPISHNFIEGLGTDGSFLFGQPSSTDLSPISANSILGALTTAPPSSLLIPSCSTLNSALTWASGVGFGCNSVVGGTSAFSSLTAATASNSIQNVNFSQTWNWDSLTSGTALTISSTGITSGTLLNVNANNSTNTGYAGYFSNTSSGGFAVYANGASEFNGSTSQTGSTPSLSGSTFTPDFSKANDFVFVLVHASCPCTIANPVNTYGVQDGTIEIDQSATGSDTITWGSAYKFPGAVSPILSTTSSAQDYFGYHEKDSTHVIVGGGVLNAH